MMATPDDILEAKRIANARRMAQTSMQSRSKSLTDLESSVSKSKQEAIAAAATAAETLKQAEADKAAAIQAQIDAARTAGTVAAQTGGTINPNTGLISKPTTGSKKVIGYVKWTNPINGVTYNVPKYDDGTDAISEWGGGAQVPQSFMISTPTGGGGSTGGGGNVDTGAAERLKAQQAAAAAAEEKRRKGQSAFDLLSGEFERYGMGSLLNDVKSFIVDGLSRDELLLKLRATPAYEKRFAANTQRIKSGLRALSEAEYIQLEDQYQNVMRNYGLPASYYTKGDMGVQQGFEKFIAGDVSAAELEDRIQTAQNRVVNAAPEVSKALRQFYPDITNGDILAYALDPSQALTNIKRKVTAAEIGAGALQAGLTTGLTRAEELAKYGVTGQQARQGYQTIAEFLPTATKLSDIYQKQGLGEYGQSVAEQEVFGTAGAAEAATKRKKLAQLEQAQFSGSTGVTKGALARERAGQF